MVRAPAGREPWGFFLPRSRSRGSNLQRTVSVKLLPEPTSPRCPMQCRSASQPACSTHFNLAITYLTEVYCRGRDRVKPAQMENPRWQARVWGLGTHSNHNRGVSQMKSALEYSETQEESGDDVVTEGQSGRRTVISGSRPIPPYTPSPTGAVEESPESIVGDHQLSPISVG